MGYHMMQGCSFAWSGHRAVFLDLARDRYLGLSIDQDEAFRNLLSIGRPDAQTSPILDALLDLRLVRQTDGESSTLLPCEAEIPTRTLAGSKKPSSYKLRARCVRAQWQAAIFVKQAALRDIVSRVSRLRASASFDEGDDKLGRLRQIDAGFKSTKWLRPLATQCLVSSLALVDAALLHGVDCQIVIGVHARPFGAHAWAQHEDILLGDHLDTVQQFAPILVI